MLAVGVGVALAAASTPVAGSCMRAGWRVGLGAALAIAVVVSAASGCVAALALERSAVVSSIAAVLLLGVGLRRERWRVGVLRSHATTTPGWSACASGFFTQSASPITVLACAAMATTLAGRPLALAFGVFAGAMGWWMMVASARRSSAWLERVGDEALVILAVVAIARALVALP